MRAQRGWLADTVGRLRLPVSSWRRRAAPVPWAALEHVVVMQQAVELDGNRGDYAEQFPPILDGTVRSQGRAGALVAAPDDSQQIFGSGVRITDSTAIRFRIEGEVEVSLSPIGIANADLFAPAQYRPRRG
jgi:hypothetical protein